MYKFLLFNIVFLNVFACFGQNVASKNTAVLPLPDHIVVLIYENHPYTSIIGSANTPYINALANDTNAAVFTQAYGISHPSQPNYLALFSGDMQGVSNDSKPASTFVTPNLARQLMDSSKTFITYSEDIPSVGFDGGTSGNYARKHNPVANWVGTGINQVPDTLNQPFTAFPSSNLSLLPTVSYVVPNINNDMHDAILPWIITDGDTWMHTNLNNYIQWAINNNSLFIITFDEDDNLHNNRITTIFYGPMVQGGQYPEHIDHYNILRTIEDIYKLPYAGNAATATTITDCWKQPVVPNGINNVVESSFAVKAFPNPASQKITFSLGSKESKCTLNITDITGRPVSKYDLSTANNEINTSAYAPGIYFYQAIINNTSVSTGNFIISH